MTPASDVDGGPGDVSAGPASQVVLVVGTGLIGGSIALALQRAGHHVWLDDHDEAALRLATELGAGSPGRPTVAPSVVFVAVPPASVALVVEDLQRIYLKAIFSDASSVKSYVEADLRSLGADLARFVGSHPLAGRERSGPGAARADLFEGRPWVLTPTAETPGVAVDTVRRLVLDCGAQPVVADAALHDEAVAVTSHVPQIVASLTAARLVDAEPATLTLAGQGLQDMTRIADSDPELWSEIVAANAGPVLSVLDAFAADLEQVRSELRSLQTVVAGKGGTDHKASSQPPDKDTDRLVDIATRTPATRALIQRGNAGRSRLPGKHGAARVEFAVVPVVVMDRPGELARLLVASGVAGVNVEDVAIEHSPGQPAGLVELSVRPEVAAQLAAALRADGWSVHA